MLAQKISQYTIPNTEQGAPWTNKNMGSQPRRSFLTVIFTYRTNSCCSGATGPSPRPMVWKKMSMTSSHFHACLIAMRHRSIGDSHVVFQSWARCLCKSLPAACCCLLLRLQLYVLPRLHHHHHHLSILTECSGSATKRRNAETISRSSRGPSLALRVFKPCGRKICNIAPSATIRKLFRPRTTSCGFVLVPTQDHIMWFCPGNTLHEPRLRLLGSSPFPADSLSFVQRRLAWPENPLRSPNNDMILTWFVAARRIVLDHRWQWDWNGDLWSPGWGLHALP